MGNIERWHIYVCAEHGNHKPVTMRDCPRCGVEMERVEVARASTTEGAVDLLTIADALAIAVLNGDAANARVVAEGYRSGRIAAATERQ